jgi:hypothetical protein
VTKTGGQIPYSDHELLTKMRSHFEFDLLIIIQAHPFQNNGLFDTRVPKYDLQMYAENHAVRTHHDNTTAHDSTITNTSSLYLTPPPPPVGEEHRYLCVQLSMGRPMLR